MSAALESRAEVAKLAGLLSVPVERFDALAELSPATLRELREQVTDVLYDSDVGALKRAAAASRHIPPAISATVAQKAFGPLLCARISGLVDTRTAVAVAGRLPTAFLADVSVAMDPRRASDVIGALPADGVIEVAAELARRGEHVTMGRFVGHLDDATIVGCFAVLSDADMLEAGFVMEDKDRLDTIIGLLPAGRLQGIITAAHEDGLWPEALDLFTHVSPARRGELGDVALGQDDAHVEAMLEAVQREDLWDTLADVAATMGPESRRRLRDAAGDRVPAHLRAALGD